MKTITFTLAFAFFLCLSTGAAHSALGPHGGQVRALASREHHVLPGYSVELVERSPGDSKKKKFEIYVLRPDSSPVDLMSSGYWAVSWRAGSKEGQLHNNVAEEKKRIWDEKPPYTPLYSFLAEGDIPKHPATTLEVTIALPSKGGTGVATFTLPISKD